MAFLPYMETIFEEVFKLLEVSGQWVKWVGTESSGPCVPPAQSRHIPLLILQCPHPNVRKAAHEALGQFCCALHKTSQSFSPEPSTAGEKGVRARLGPVEPEVGG